MDCQTFREQIAELILPGGDPRARANMEAHAKSCPACAQYLAEMKRALSAIQPSTQIKATAGFKERVMNKVTKMEERESRPRRHWGWRFAMAAAVLIVFGLVMFKGNNTNNGSAWAIEKTIEAYKSVRFIHIKCEPVGEATDYRIGELWGQFDEQGNPVTLRWDFPNTQDGPKAIFWQQQKAEIWFKKKGTMVIMRLPDALKKLKMQVVDFDPHMLLEKLHQQRADGEIELKVVDGVTTDGLLRLSIIAKDKPLERTVYFVDPNTQLIARIENYRTENGREAFVSRKTFLDYNDPKVAEVFNERIPEDVARFDEVSQQVGLLKGELSDKEIAVKVVRTFYEALIAKDYAKAGLMFGGLNEAQTRENFGNVKYIRIISIGEPVPEPINNSLKVPCKIEREKNGKREVYEPYGPYVRRVNVGDKYWAICGGL